MRSLTIAALAGLAAHASAECANACSGHGECKNKDQCVCYDNYKGADCSERICPFGLAFVDVPNGDLNHDGVVGYYNSEAGVNAFSQVSWSKYPQAEFWPQAAKTINGYTSIAAKDGEAHFYAECSGKGVCDRSTGECACYDGYTGEGCARTACANDCSGHGVCRTVAEIAKGALNAKFEDSASGQNIYSGVVEAFNYRLWDADKHQSCVCDRGYGGNDCSLVECPRGDDPLTNAKKCDALDLNNKQDFDALVKVYCQNEVQTFIVEAADDLSFKIVFTDFFGKEWSTSFFTLNDSVDDDAKAANIKTVKEALESLPNNVVGEVEVNVQKKYSNNIYKVLFKTLSGNVAPFEIVANAGTNPAVAQPAQPLQELTSFTVGGSVTVTINPTNTGIFRPYELTGTDTTIKKALYKSSAVFNYLGAFSGDDRVVDSGFTVLNTGTDYLLVPDYNTKNPERMAIIATNPIFVDGTTEAATTPLGRDGSSENSVCSNRGLCDYSTGVCGCFKGYYGAACEQQNALAM